MRPLSDLQWQIIGQFGELNLPNTPARVSRNLGRKVKRSGSIRLKEYKLTDSQRVVIHRSMRSLVARGLMQVDEKHCYCLTDEGLVLADAHFPGLAERRAAKTREWEQYRATLQRVLSR